MSLNDTDSYASILEQAWDDVPDEATVPAGVYRLRCVNAGAKEADPSANRPARAWFAYSIVEPGKEVAPEFEKLNRTEVDALEIMISFNLKRKFDITRLNGHILAHGVVPKAGMSRKDLIGMCKNTEVMAFCAPDEYTDKNTGDVIATTRATEFMKTK